MENSNFGDEEIFSMAKEYLRRMEGSMKHLQEIVKYEIHRFLNSELLRYVSICSEGTFLRMVYSISASWDNYKKIINKLEFLNFENQYLEEVYLRTIFDPIEKIFFLRLTNGLPINENVVSSTNVIHTKLNKITIACIYCSKNSGFGKKITKNNECFISFNNSHKSYIIETRELTLADEKIEIELLNIYSDLYDYTIPGEKLTKISCILFIGDIDNKPPQKTKAKDAKSS
uniref:Uncharacterized protein n=1 Tax=Acrobeloides nanus TaxID=290746 RepID=A0A914CET5_9BILA